MKNYPGLDPESHFQLSNEMHRARVKFPENKFLLAACMEELGELADSYGASEGRERERAEALQIACVAMRIYEEGDASAGNYGPTQDAISALGLAVRFMLQRKAREVTVPLVRLVIAATHLVKNGDQVFRGMTEAQSKP